VVDGFCPFCIVRALLTKIIVGLTQEFLSNIYFSHAFTWTKYLRPISLSFFKSKQQNEGHWNKRRPTSFVRTGLSQFG
jgi:hypothetical protein